MNGLGETGSIQIPKPKEKPTTKESEETPQAEIKKVNLKTPQMKGQDVYKIDLSKPKEEEQKEEGVVAETIDDEESVKEESKETVEDELELIEVIEGEEGNIEESKSEVVEKVALEKEEGVVEEKTNTPDLPENIQKVIEFMNETGGGLEDYVRLNADYSKVDEKQLLKEYYKQTQSHLDDEDISFKIEEFGFDEELDDERDIKRKKLQFKEEVSKARKHLEGLKDKYYDEVRLSSKLSPEQKEAVEFYNSHKEQSRAVQENKQDFIKKTEQFFSEDFKGFDFKVGDKKYRYKVKDVKGIKEKQSDFANVYGKFFDEKSGSIKDTEGYHKALFVAENYNSIAEHFMNQGRAEAIKEMDAEAKNINVNGRKDHSSNITVKGTTIKAVKGDDSRKVKIKSNIVGRR